MTLIGVKFCMMVDMGPGHKVSQKWPKKSQSLTANISKTVNRSVTCQLELKISSMRAFQKCIKWDGSFPGESPIKKNMYFFTRGQISRADRRENLHDGRVLSHKWISPLLAAIF